MSDDRQKLANFVGGQSWPTNLDTRACQKQTTVVAAERQRFSNSSLFLIKITLKEKKTSLTDWCRRVRGYCWDLPPAVIHLAVCSQCWRMWML